MNDHRESRFQATYFGQSDVGLLRERNEDSCLLFPAYRFAAVADGMGGHMSGDIASSLAIATLQRFFTETVGPDSTWPFPFDSDLTEEENCLVVGIRLANQNVFRQAQRSSSDSNMGTTVVALMLSGDHKRISIGHVGDSRCYRIRDGSISQLTSDHSLVSEVTEIAPWLSQAEIDQLPSNIITRALGMGPDVMVDLLTTETRLGDHYLLCSDGLNGMISDEDIAEIVSSDGKTVDVCEELVAAANAAGGNDNTTVSLVRIVAHDDAAASTSELHHAGAIVLLNRDDQLAELTEPSSLLPEDATPPAGIPAALLDTVAELMGDEDAPPEALDDSAEETGDSAEETGDSAEESRVDAAED